jgi:hypothetical protein
LRLDNQTPAGNLLPMTAQPDPRRKFYLLKALASTLGPNLDRNKLSVVELQAIADENGVSA